jgi:murein DD-endopeptidase MepM/ murein hydrolase activator NlpD
MLLVPLEPRALAPALALTAALSLGAQAAPFPPPAKMALDGRPPPAQALAQTECPSGTIPDADGCVHLPDGDEPSGPETDPEASAHHDRRGRWILYDQIPRRPDRPADYDLYLYPVPCARDCVISGYDLDLPDEQQRRGRRLSHVGHGAVDLPGKRGAPIDMVPLEHQQGDADVVYAGPLFGTTVVTRHTVREGGQLRDYVVVFGHLDAPAPGLRTGSHLKDGDLVGFVGDTGSPELVHLHLETRRVRDGVDAAKLGPAGLVANENTVVCDPRNVLPLRAKGP